MKILSEKGYTYQKHLSTGGEGEVHLVTLADKQFVAKVFPELSQTSKDILKTIRQLNLPAIPKIREIFDYEDKTIVVRDYAAGNTLYDEIHKNEYLTLNRAKVIIKVIGETLGALHGAEPDPIIYRDLKPENIIITPDGDVKLIDFGIARYHKSEALRDTVLAGTNGYTAPEVMAGMQSDTRSDVYSAGLLLYEMITGKNLLMPPFQIRPVKESNELLPNWLDAVIQKATDLNQTKRYKTIDEFIYAVENSQQPKKKKQSKKKKPKRKALAGTVIGVCALLLVLSAALILSSIGVFSNNGYEMLLELGFEDEEDMRYITGSQDPDGRFEMHDGMLHVFREACSLEYLLSNNMIVHFRMRTTNPGGSVGLGQYRISSSLEFECLLFNHENEVELTTSGRKLTGMPIINKEQWLDVMLYTNEDNSAVYAVICDNESGNIAFAAYQTPEGVDGSSFMVDIAAAFEEEHGGFMQIDHLCIAEGSLLKYIKERTDIYQAQKHRIDSFFSQDVSSLPQLEFRPPHEWN